jgi:hypothetical protein
MSSICTDNDGSIWTRDLESVLDRIDCIEQLNNRLNACITNQPTIPSSLAIDVDIIASIGKRILLIVQHLHQRIVDGGQEQQHMFVKWQNRLISALATCQVDKVILDRIVSYMLFILVH